MLLSLNPLYEDLGHLRMLNSFLHEIWFPKIRCVVTLNPCITREIADSTTMAHDILAVLVIGAMLVEHGMSSV